jgi:probable rRNA maturation factor
LIHVFDRQKDLKISKSSARALVQSVFEHLAVPCTETCTEIGVYFVTEKRIAELHAEFFQDPTPTDCISFPIGEIFVCPKVAISYAQKHNLDPYAETSLYLVHGLLHLLGYDDLEPKEKRRMRQKEKSCIGYLHKVKGILHPP